GRLGCNGAKAAASEPVDFRRDIRPILAGKCFLCHGPDAKARKADLRLDIKEGALRTADPVIVRGKSSQSELILRVPRDDAQEVMPPRNSGKSLTPNEIAFLTRWVDEGAVWTKPWASESPRRVTPPAGSHTSLARNPIDAFIFARLDAEKLSPEVESE